METAARHVMEGEGGTLNGDGTFTMPLAEFQATFSGMSVAPTGPNQSIS